MMRRLSLLASVVLVVLFLPAPAGELEEVARLAPKYGGRTEVRLADGTRVDLLTATHAIEADWPRKWAEAIGQSLYYGLMTGKRPGIILLSTDAERDARYVARCRTVTERYGIDLWVEPVAKPRESKKRRTSDRERTP